MMAAVEPREVAVARILLVEDYFVVAEAYRALLDRLGFEVVGPAATVARALSLVERGGVDAAILDVSLHGQLVTPVAERLQELGVPFLFLTGMKDLEQLPEALRGAPTIEKPAGETEVREALERAGVTPPPAVTD